MKAAITTSLRRPTVARGVLATVAALGVLIAVAPSAPPAATPSRSAERAFLQDMVMHHTMAVEMAKMAQEKATHQDLKEAAREIIDAQTAEIGRMERWLKRWYDARPEHEMTEEMEHQMRELEESSGAAFELRFLALMSVHHTQAVERARAFRPRAVHREVRKLAGDIIRAQEREIEQFRAWLVAWYAG